MNAYVFLVQIFEAIIFFPQGRCETADDIFEAHDYFWILTFHVYQFVYSRIFFSQTRLQILVIRLNAGNQSFFYT